MLGPVLFAQIVPWRLHTEILVRLIVPAGDLMMLVFGHADHIIGTVDLRAREPLLPARSLFDDVVILIAWAPLASILLESTSIFGSSW